MTSTCLALTLFFLTGDKPENTEQSLKALLTHLQTTKGSTIADIGSGRGKESWVFSALVGKEGHVFAEEISEKKVKELKSSIKKKKIKNVQAVLGKGDDPCIPDKSCDLIFMKRVYHHFSKPRKMLQQMWHDLKPGGYLVVVDRHRGTLKDWVPRERRATKHFWLAETTVVREAREEGFLFVELAEQFWHDKKPFVTVFKRPEGISEPHGDPDPLKPLTLKAASSFFKSQNIKYKNPVFIALGEARKLLPAITKTSSGNSKDIILEEWATQKKERPHIPENFTIDSTLTQNGDPHLSSSDKTNAVFFLDTYHLLFHHKTLLGKLKNNLTPEGKVYILDRKATKPLKRRLASHRRKIHPDSVKKEMQKAGFKLSGKGPIFAKDRFLLIFTL